MSPSKDDPGESGSDDEQAVPPLPDLTQELRTLLGSGGQKEPQSPE